jgi:hypothetical protein
MKNDAYLHRQRLEGDTQPHTLVGKVNSIIHVSEPLPSLPLSTYFTQYSHFLRDKKSSPIRRVLCFLGELETLSELTHSAR